VQLFVVLREPLEVLDVGQLAQCLYHQILVSLLSYLCLNAVLLQAQYFFEPSLILTHELGHLVIEVLLEHEHLAVPVALHYLLQPVISLLHPFLNVTCHQQEISHVCY
jgi:hypothetical protein